MQTLLCVLVLGKLVLGALSGTYVLHETRALEPEQSGWLRARRLESDKVLPLRIGLKQRNLHALEDLLMSISHPDSPQYGQHWSSKQVVDTFAPSPATIEAVTNWLVDSGFSLDRIRLTGNKGWIQVNATVEEAEQLLKTEYHAFVHPSGLEQIGCRDYSVPVDLRDHIDLIKPTVHFNQRPATELNVKRSGGLGSPSSSNGPKKLKTLDQGSVPVFNLSNCDQFITLECLRTLYSIDYKPVETKKNSYGIVEFTPQAFLAGDLDLFFSTFSPGQVGDRPVQVLIDGAVVQTTMQNFSFNGESDLDLEYGMALVNPQPITLLQTGDLVEGASFDNWLDAVDASFCTFEGGDDPTQDGIYPDPLPGGFDGPESCGIIAPPNVVSVSYGQDESTVTAKYAERQCAEYAKLGMMGTTVLYSSGDFGVAGFDGVCINADGSPPSTNGTIFNPGFPVGCPFVTAVGATQVNPNSSVFAPESACEQVIFSGGGFSNIFAIPDYQKTVVSNFLRNFEKDPPFSLSLFNSSGTSRAFPDLSANGANYVIAIDGQLALVFGTSASSPVVGSMITLVNDARIARGKSPVGFINPAIYHANFSSAFHDITTGGNQGCGTPGFTATRGWDPVTGVGTPDLVNLMALFLQLP